MPMTVDEQREAYRRMYSIRRFDEEGSRLYLAGKIDGSYHSSIGEEAAIVGACMAVRDSDSMTGTHRSHGHPIGKGGALNVLMAELYGRATGVCRGRGGSMHLADGSVGVISESSIVGGGIPLATGCGLAAKVQGLDDVTLCFFGDGAVNQGVFHESLNMASIWKLPVVYVCENNGFAVMTSLEQTHGQPSVARRADGYGIPGIEVDGQDITAVYEAARVAVDRARRGEGPTLIEAKTYRFDDHSVGLVIPGEPYRDAKVVEEYRASRDPLKLFRVHMLAAGIAEEEIAAIEAGVDKEVEDAIAFADSSPYPEVLANDDYLFATALA